MNNPLAKFYSWQVNSGALDGWTSYHLAAGLFIAKVAQWLGATDFWAVMWVVIIGVAWEIFEYFVEGTEETYGTKEKWAWNTETDLFVEIAAACQPPLKEEVGIKDEVVGVDDPELASRPNADMILQAKVVAGQLSAAA